MKPSDPAKRSAPRVELSVVASGLLILMLAAMWVQRPAANCAMPFEAPQFLVLSRETDREHLAADIATAARTARRYMTSTVNPIQQREWFLNCEAELVQQIATTHGLSADRVQAHDP